MGKFLFAYLKHPRGLLSNFTSLLYVFSNSLTYPIQLANLPRNGVSVRTIPKGFKNYVTNTQSIVESKNKYNLIAETIQIIQAIKEHFSTAFTTFKKIKFKKFANMPRSPLLQIYILW